MDSIVPQQSVSGTNPPSDKSSVLESAYSKVRTVSDKLVRCKTIPELYHGRLKERLSYVCGNSDEPSAAHTRYRRTRTYNAYTTVLQLNPKAFLPFILAISPRACRDMDIVRYCESYPETRSIFLNDVENLLDTIVKGLNIHGTPKYKQIKEHLHPTHSFSTKPPMTVDEGGEVMELELANTLPCRTNLGDRIFDSVESHPGRMVDQVETATRTCLIKTQMPKNSFKDVLMQIETGPVGITDLAQKLLPNSYQLMHWLLHDETSTYNPERPSQRCELEEGWVILRGASIAGIQWAFPMSICSAIESSQLRAWEVEHGIQDTECLMMRLKIARGKPCCAIFTLRLGFIQAVGLTQRIYS